MKQMLWLFAILVLSGQAIAVPSLEVSNYSTTPSILYPGTQGYLSVVISNVGETATDSGAVSYSALGISDTFQIGSLGSGAKTMITIPITISPKTSNGIQLVSLSIAYTYSDTSSSPASKKSAENSISIPLEVKQVDPLRVEESSFDKTSISAGETVTVNLTLRNVGGIINNAKISVPENSSFLLGGKPQVEIGSIASNSSVPLSFVLMSSSASPTGTYGVPMVISYQDQLNAPVEETVSIGPITVAAVSMNSRVALVPESTVEVGSEVVFNLSVTNSGSSPVSAMVSLNSTTAFMPIGMQTVYFDSIPAGSTASKEVKIGISSSVSAGYYLLPMQLTTIPGSSTSYNAGIAVEATPDIRLILLQGSGTSQIQITNTGNSQIRSVDIIVTQGGSATESFIGTLNVDDYSTVPLGSASLSGVDVKVTFRDTNNQLHTVEKALSSSSTFADSTTNRSGSTGFAGQNRSGTGFGLFGPGTNAGGSSIDLGLLAVVVGAVGICGFLVYSRFFRKPKPKAPVEQKK